MRIRDFYIERLPLTGWYQVDDLGGDGIAFTRNGWKISIHNKNIIYIFVNLTPTRLYTWIGYKL